MNMLLFVFFIKHVLSFILWRKVNSVFECIIIICFVLCPYCDMLACVNVKKKIAFIFLRLPVLQQLFSTSV